MDSPKITPFLWFDDNAEEAVDYYCSVFPHAVKKGRPARQGRQSPDRRVRVGRSAVHGPERRAALHIQRVGFVRRHVQGPGGDRLLLGSLRRRRRQSLGLRLVQRQVRPLMADRPAGRLPPAEASCSHAGDDEDAEVRHRRPGNRGTAVMERKGRFCNGRGCAASDLKSTMRRAIQFVLIVALVLSGGSLTFAVMPCCAQAPHGGVSPAMVMPSTADPAAKVPRRAIRCCGRKWQDDCDSGIPAPLPPLCRKRTGGQRMEQQRAV